MTIWSKENLSWTIESSNKILWEIEESLSSLKIEAWIDFFKKAWDWIKTHFSSAKKKREIEWEITWNTYSENHESNNNLKVSETWNYIANGWTFYSPTKGICRRNDGKYKWVCSKWSYEVLELLWLTKKSNSNEVDLTWNILTQMWLTYIWKVDPKNPSKNWYKPQDGDTAVWPKFKRKSWKITQHQATFINGHWVSDTIQKNMSCYKNEPNEPKCLIYRYNNQQV